MRTRLQEIFDELRGALSAVLAPLVMVRETRIATENSLWAACDAAQEAIVLSRAPAAQAISEQGDHDIADLYKRRNAALLAKALADYVVAALASPQPEAAGELKPAIVSEAAGRPTGSDGA